MNEDKLYEIQHQARRNQADIQDFLKDLDGWSSDIKQKDQNLKKALTEETALPPIRNSLDQKKKKKLKKKKETDKNGDKTLTKSKKLSGFDFKAWDKFDVDAACAAVDDDGPKESSSDYETDEEWEEQRRLQQAQFYKDQGNQLFKEHKYDQAIECYTNGIECDPSNALLPANRAMALLKNNRYAAAELDCTAAIALDSTYVKAFSRRGTARLQLKKLKEAKNDFEEVVRLEASNKQAKTEITRIEKLLLLAQGNIKADDGGLVKAVYKAPENRSQQPLRRIQIEEIGLEEQAPMEKRANPAGAEEKFDEFLKKPSDKPLSPADILRTKPSQNSQPESISVPTNSFHFLTNCKSLRSSPQDFYTYLKNIPPKMYVKLLGESLETDVLVQVLNTLKDFYIIHKDAIYPVLDNLTRVKRFSMTAMFLSSTDKKTIAELLDYVQANESVSEADLKKLKNQYSI